MIYTVLSHQYTVPYIGACNELHLVTGTEVQRYSAPPCCFYLTVVPETHTSQNRFGFREFFLKKEKKQYFYEHD
jgi:hypothetical protein